MWLSMHRTVLCLSWCNSQGICSVLLYDVYLCIHIMWCIHILNSQHNGLEKSVEAPPE